jgi:ankyrin repeat protein
LPIWKAGINGAAVEGRANVNLGKLFHACAMFEDEQELWTRTSNDTGIKPNICAGGLKLTDTSRPKISGDSRSSPSGYGSNRDTARLEEILNMLMDAGADISPLHLQNWNDDGALVMAINGNRTYTIANFVRAQERRAATDSTVRFSACGPSFILHSRKYLQEAKVQALRSFEYIKTGEGNSRVLETLLQSRQYDLAEELSNVGVDFLIDDQHARNSNIGILVQQGHADLIERIGNLEAKAKLSKGVWHAMGDRTRAGLHREVSAKHAEHGGENFGSFLYQAVSRELPNMDVVRLLVESFYVDINELHYEKRHTGTGYENVPTDSDLLSTARGGVWWQAALALPYLVEQGADLEVRNHEGMTPLLVALSGDDAYLEPFRKDSARRLIAAGADVNASDRMGLSCLAHAGNDVEMIRQLIAHGAIVKADALFAAIDCEQVEVLEALLSAGVDGNIRMECRSELPMANRYDMLSVRANGNNVEWHERYPLHYAAIKHEAYVRRPEDERKRTTEVVTQLVQVLLAHGADPFAKFKVKLPVCKDNNDDDDSETGIADHDTMHAPGASSSAPEPTVDVTSVGPVISSQATGYEECVIPHELLINSDLVHPS